MRIILMFILWICTTVAIAQSSYKVNSNGGLNLRENPGKDSKTITSLPDGTKVTVLDKSNEKWWKVKVDGKTGYVSSDFLNEDNAKASNQTSQQESKNTSKSNNQGNNQKSNYSGTSGNTPGSWAAGIRLGDPTGLTVKKYLHKNRAFDINFGRTSHWGNNYKNHFYNYDKFKNYDYQGYNRGSALSFQFHYLYNKNISGAEGLQWYLGFGPQLRYRSYTYSYRYKYGPGAGDWAFGQEKVSDLGLDGVVGLEYKFNNTPLSIYGEFGLFMEVFDQPFLFRGQGGLGIRFHF
jgi:hypothetical protein